ncbi:MAG: diguanylate cyclase [Lysobacter sp.]|nr:MAG: diguanylate cyclase [Lysobacter sp.]
MTTAVADDQAPAPDRLFASVNFGIGVVDPEGGWRHANAALHALLHVGGALPTLPALLACDPAGDALALAALRRGEREALRLDCRLAREGRIHHVMVELMAPAGPRPHEGLLLVHAREASMQAPSEPDAFSTLTTDLLAVTDVDGLLVEVNHAWETTLGWAATELSGQWVTAFVHVDDREPTSAFLRDVRVGAADAGFRNRMRSRYGGYRWLEWNARCVGTRLYCIARDVTAQVRGRESVLRQREELERRIAERTAELDHALHRLQLHADNSPLAAIEFDHDLRITQWSRRAVELFGWSEDDVLGRSLSQWPFLPADETAGVVAAMDAMFRREHSRSVHVAHMLTRDGRRLACEWFDSALFDAQGEVSSILALVLDIQARTDAEQALQQARDGLEAKVAERTLELECLMAMLENQASQDPLTGLPNRRGLMERLPRSIDRSSRHAGATVVMFVDLDRFKQVNDRHGHEAGDILLRECARRLVSVVRKTDIVARLGGDEFVIVLENVREPETHARQVAEKIRAALARPVAAGAAAVAVSVSASVGVAVHRHGHGPELAEDLIARADRRMYEVKHLGGNAVRVQPREDVAP